MEFGKAEMNAALEILAIDLHSETPALEAHHTIAKQMWGHIKALEYTSGRFLAFGRDAELLAGAPLDAARMLDGLVITGGTDHDQHVADRVLLAGDLPGCSSGPTRTSTWNQSTPPRLAQRMS